MDYPVVFWEEVVSAYHNFHGNNYFLNVLKLAIDKFDDLKAGNTGRSISYGNNMDYKLSGEKIIEFHNNGKEFWVGRFGGITGSKFRTDIQTENWKNYEYEINITSKIVPNNNWFSSSQFIKAVGIKNMESIIENEKPSEEINIINSKNSSIALDDWHFAHLGRDYFLDISSKVGSRDKWDAPINLVYIGKKGVPYIEKKRGRQVNPNWAVIMKNGREIKYKSGSNNMPENGLWDKKNCIVFSWQEIREFFENQLLIKK